MIGVDFGIAVFNFLFHRIPFILIFFLQNIRLLLLGGNSCFVDSDDVERDEGSIRVDGVKFEQGGLALVGTLSSLRVANKQMRCLGVAALKP